MLRYLATRILILLLSLSLGISSCKPIARSHYDHLTEEEEKNKPNWKKRALVFGSAALVAVGGWRLAKYLDQKLGRGVLSQVGESTLAPHKSTPVRKSDPISASKFYDGKFDKPPLYKLIAPDSSEHWLLGTMHVGVSLYDLPANSRVLKAIDESTSLLCEADLNSMLSHEAIALALKYETAYKTANFDLRAALGNDYMDRLRNEFGSEGITKLFLRGIDLEKLNPSQVQLLLLEIASSKAFGRQVSSIDEELMSRARKNGKNVIGLETVEDAIDVFMKLMKAETPAEELRKFIDDGGLSHQTFQLMKVRNAWGRGDLDAIRNATGGSLYRSNDPRMKALLDERNLNWVKSQEIQRNCQQGKKCTVAVGLAHLFDGKNSLSKLLSAEGFRIEKVY